MQAYNLEELKEFAVSEFMKKELVVTDSFKLLYNEEKAGNFS